MPVEALRIDGDDLDMDLLPAIERSFGLQLVQADVEDLRTVGDLHAMILSKSPGASGAACGTVLTFNLLRRALADLGMDQHARPDLMLGEQGLPTPKQLRRTLVLATGLEIPGVVVGGWCLAAIGIFVLLPSLGWVMDWPWLVLATPPACWLAARQDQGSWSGEWTTLGTLARATAALNHAALAGRGARHSPQSVWNTLRTLLAGYGVGTRDMGPGTWLLAPPPGRP